MQNTYTSFTSFPWLQPDLDCIADAQIKEFQRFFGENTELFGANSGILRNIRRHHYMMAREAALDCIAFAQIA